MGRAATELRCTSNMGTCRHIHRNEQLHHTPYKRKSIPALSPPRRDPRVGGHRIYYPLPQAHRRKAPQEAARGPPGSLYRLAARAARLPRAPRGRDAGLRPALRLPSVPLAQGVEGLHEEGALLRTAHGEAQLLPGLGVGVGVGVGVEAK